MRWPSVVPVQARPLTAREVFDAACGRLVDAVMAGDREAALLAYAEAAAALGPAFPAVLGEDRS